MVLIVMRLRPRVLSITVQNKILSIECCYAKCRYAKCRYAKCHGALGTLQLEVFQNLFSHEIVAIIANNQGPVI